MSGPVYSRGGILHPSYASVKAAAADWPLSHRRSKSQKRGAAAEQQLGESMPVFIQQMISRSSRACLALRNSSSEARKSVKLAKLRETRRTPEGYWRARAADPGKLV